MSNAYDFDLIVIGSGPAGQSAAIQAAKLHKRVALIEKRKRVGGVCTFTGTIPSKSLREAILDVVRPHRLPGGGWNVIERPTMKSLTDRVDQVIQSEASVVRDGLGRNDVQVFEAEASFVDAHRIRLGGAAGGDREITGEHIFIGCGTVAAAPPTGPSDGQVILTSDDILHLPELPSSLAVVGGGVIGVEYASIFAAAGVQVTLIDRRERLLEFVDREIVDELMHQMRKTDVTFRLGEAVARVEVFDEGRPEVEVELESGKRIIAEAVLFSIGRTPVTAPLALGNAGVESDPRGRIPVDESFQTNVPNIYAAGDVIGFPALAATSSEQGRIAACRMFGADAADFDRVYPYGIYAVPEISMCGETEETLTKAKVPYEVGVARYRETARGQIMGDDTGMFKMLFHRETRALLGVHCIGTHATELIHIGQAVIALGGGLDYFMNAVFNYPTLAEVYKIAAHNAANRLRHVRVRNGQTDGRTTGDSPVTATEVPTHDDPRPVMASRLTERAESAD